MPDTAAPDQVTALLDAMYERRGEDRVLEDLACLIAAVRAGFAHHYIEPGIFPPQCATCRYWDDVLEEYVGVTAPCPTQEAMTRALLGEDGT